MSAQAITESELFKRCLESHGHLCPGLSLGYQAAMAGMISPPGAMSISTSTTA